MTLPADVSRCQGIDASNLPCDIRHKCERYLALMDPPAKPTHSPQSRFLCVRQDGSVDTSFPFFIPDAPAKP